MPRRNNLPKPIRDQTRPNQCGSKKRYPSEAVARQVIADRQQLLDDGLALDTYRCPQCSGWHLTRSTDH